MKYTAWFRKNDSYYSIEFPDFGIQGEGYSSYEETKNFACDFLAEAILAYRSAGKPLPSQGKMSSDRISEDASVEIIEVDVEKYYETGKKIASRTYVSDIVRQEDNATNIPLHNKYRGQIHSQINDLRNKATSRLENYANSIPHKKAIAAAILAIMICVTGVSVSNNIKDYKQNKHIEQTIQSSREHIESGNYEDACDELTRLFGAKGTDSHKKEIDSLYNYSYMKNERQKSSPVGIAKQYDCSRKIAFESDDEFYKDAEKLKAEIKEEYDADQLKKHVARQQAEEEKKEREKQAAIEAEKQEAKKMREYYEKLATTIPFKGMEVKYVDCTACGAHDYEETSISGLGDYDYLYYWQTEEANWFRTYIKGEEIVRVEILRPSSVYWNDDGLPNVEEIKKLKKPKIDEYGSTRDSEVDEYWTGKEYADTKYKEYKKEIKNSENYKEHSEEDLDNISWIKAFNHWLENHNPRFYDARG